MGYRIDNFGLRFLDHDVGSVLRRLHDARPAIQDMRRSAQAKWIATRAREVADEAILDGLVASDPYGRACREFSGRVAAVDRDGARDPEVDFSFRLYVIVSTGRVLGLCSTDWTDMVRFLSKAPMGEAYPLASGECPEGIDPPDWDRYGADWSLALAKGGNVPSRCGVLFEHVTFGLPPFAQVMTETPTLEERVSRLAWKRAMGAHVGKARPDGIAKTLVAIRHFVDHAATRTGITELEETKATVRRAIGTTPDNEREGIRDAATLRR